MRIVLIALAVLIGIASRASASDEAAIRGVIARWYSELEKQGEGRPWALAAPGFIDASPWYRHIDNGSAKLGPRVYTSLAARALQFSYEITALRADENFAKVTAWEKGYFYAWAAEKTYEAAASTTFVLERQLDGAWLILAHRADSIGIPPDRITDPMPDLRELWLETRQDGDRP